MEEMMTRTNIAIRLFVCCFAITAAQAAVIYNFVGTAAGDPQFDRFPQPVAFRLTVPDFINAPLNTLVSSVSFTCAQLDSSTNCLSPFRDPPSAVFFSYQSVLRAFSAQLEFTTSNHK